MLAKAFAYLTGGWGPLVAAGVIALVAFGGGCWVTNQINQGTIETLKAEHAQEAAKANAEALAELQRHDAAANKAVAGLRADEAKRDTTIKALRRRIHSVPKTHACVDSPAVRAVIDGLRDQPDGSH